MKVRQLLYLLLFATSSSADTHLVTLTVTKIVYVTNPAITTETTHKPHRSLGHFKLGAGASTESSAAETSISGSTSSQVTSRYRSWNSTVVDDGKNITNVSGKLSSTSSTGRGMAPYVNATTKIYSEEPNYSDESSGLIDPSTTATSAVEGWSDSDSDSEFEVADDADGESCGEEPSASDAIDSLKYSNTSDPILEATSLTYDCETVDKEVMEPSLAHVSEKSNATGVDTAPQAPNIGWLSSDTVVSKTFKTPMQSSTYHTEHTNTPTEFKRISLERSFTGVRMHTHSETAFGGGALLELTLPIIFWFLLVAL